MSNLVNDVTGRKFSRVKIVSRLPDSRGCEFGDEMPSDIIDAEIVAIGTTRLRLEGGGLVIDYRPKASTTVMRLALSFTELGMWVSYHGPVMPNRDVAPE